MKLSKITSLAVASTLLFNISCNRDEVFTPQNAQDTEYKGGILIGNEGNHGKPNAEISYINAGLSDITNNFYYTTNKEFLGDVLQNVAFSGNDAYLVANNSNKVIITDRYTFKKKGEITSEISHPRYVAFTNNHAYITNNQTKTVSIYKTSDYSFVQSISLNETVERIVEAGGSIFVQNASYGTGKKLSLINPTTNTLTKTIEIPNGNIQKTISHSGHAYVIAGDDSKSYIYQYDSAGTLVKTTDLVGLGNAGNLEIEGGNFYFTSGLSAYQLPMNDTTPKKLFTIADAGWGSFYGFNVINGKIYVSDPKKFTESSVISIYNIDGTLFKTFKAGMGANAFYKN